MANTSGANQFSNYAIQKPYGDAKRQQELTRESPISGSPFAAHALESANRAQKQATRGQQPEPPPPMVPEGAAPAPSSAAAWNQIASIPGASPLVQEYAARAQQALPVP